MNNPSENPNTNQHMQHTNDEIDLGQMFQNLWEIRWKITLFSILFFSLGLAFFGKNYYSQQLNQPMTYTINLENIINNRYPDGTQFNLSHLLLPTIVEETIAYLQLENVNYNDFKDAVQIIYFNPNITLFQRRFNELFNENKKNFEALNKLQQAINQQTNQRNSIRIILTNTLDISPNKLKLLLITLVQNWSDYFIQQGVRSKYLLDPLIVNFDAEKFEVNALTVSKFTLYMTEVNSKLENLIEANNQTAYFKEDDAIQSLKLELNNLRQTYTFQLASLLTNNSIKVSKLLENELNIQESKQLLRGLQGSLDNIQNLIPALSHNRTINNNQESAELNVEDLLSLGKKVGLTNTYTELLNRKQRLENQISSLSNSKFNYTNYTALLLNLQDLEINQSSAATYKAFAQQYLTLATKIAQKIKQYNDYFTDPNLQNLYSQTHQPHPSTSDVSNIKQLIIILGIAFLLSLATTIILLLVHSNKRAKENDYHSN